MQDNEYAVGDRKAMESGGGKYLNFISMILTKKQEINILNTFANEVEVVVEKQIIHVLIMIIITVDYTFILKNTDEKISKQIRMVKDGM